MVARGEGCKLKLYKTDSHFIRIPERWVDKVTIKKKDVSHYLRYSNSQNKTQP